MTKLGKGFEEILEAGTAHFVNVGDEPTNINIASNINVGHIKAEEITKVDGNFPTGTVDFRPKLQEADVVFNHYHNVRETEEFNAVVTDLMEDLNVESVNGEADPHVIDSMLYNVLALATMLTTGKVDDLDAPFTPIKWQEGTVTENGQNGVQVPQALEVVHSKLTGYQDNFPCRENAISLTKIEEAIMWQNKRTNDRIKRGVEGMHIK